MAAEYLLFDLLCLAGPATIGLTRRFRTLAPPRVMVFAIAWVIVPYVVWDALVAGRHWFFNPSYTLGIDLFGLPIEEVLFFVAIPYACLFSWETIVGGSAARPRRGGALAYPLVIGTLLALAVTAWVGFGLEYTALALGALALTLALDHALGTRLLMMPRAWLMVLLTLAFTGVFNGYLTARPVVTYGEAYQLGVRIGTIPVEDFIYGLGLVGACVSLYQWKRGRSFAATWLARLVEWRLGGYRQRVYEPDATKPEVLLGETQTVAVIGGGLAGLSTAAMLSERGFSVTVIEKNQHLGGKVGAWTETLADGRPAQIEHGFHAFFGHYYNLEDWLTQLGLDAKLKSVGDYVILTRDGRRLSFGTDPQTPGANIVSLAQRGLFRWRDVLSARTVGRLTPLLQYEREETFARYDDTDFASYAEEAALPADLKLAFNAFSRAFFSDDDRLSTAALMESFHFYYLSQDSGLDYRYLAGAYETDFLAPIEAHCESQGVTFRRGHGVDRIEVDADGLAVDGEAFDHVVLATDVRAARHIVEASPDVALHDPRLAQRMKQLRSGQRYSVLRLWVDVESPQDLPVFLCTERAPALDAVAFIDRVHDGAGEPGQGVIELHCYAVPDAMSDRDVRDAMVRELPELLPGYRGMTIAREHLQVRDDFTAYHVGQAQHRPGWATAIPGLYLAGDWVRLPIPAMLMEAAHTSARFVVGTICEREGVRSVPIDSVPRRGLLASRHADAPAATPARPPEESRPRAEPPRPSAPA